MVLCSKNKGADQLRGYHTADLSLCFCIHAKRRFSYQAAHMLQSLVAPTSTYHNMSVICLSFSHILYQLSSVLWHNLDSLFPVTRNKGF